MELTLRIIFAGTPEFAAAHLQALLDSEHEIVAVYTQPDRPAGRGKKLKPSAVKELALANGLEVCQPASLKTDAAQTELDAFNADLMVVVAYGLILPKAVLAMPQHGCINVHGSILPKWRGAAPIQRALWAGDTETGVTIMQMDEGLDTGDILRIFTLPITEQDTSASLYTKLAELGPSALIETIGDIQHITPQAQNNENASHAAKLSKQEAYLDWQQSAAQLERNVRAFNPWPIAWLSINENPCKVWQANAVYSKVYEQKNKTPGTVLQFDKTGLHIATADGVLVITELQLAGKKAQAVSQIVNGQADLFTVGTQLQ
jgi:methionyl-tRNA formyltransferase